MLVCIKNKHAKPKKDLRKKQREEALPRSNRRKTTSREMENFVLRVERLRSENKSEIMCLLFLCDVREISSAFWRIWCVDASMILYWCCLWWWLNDSGENWTDSNLFRAELCFWKISVRVCVHWFFDLSSSSLQSSSRDRIWLELREEGSIRLNDDDFERNQLRAIRILTKIHWIGMVVCFVLLIICVYCVQLMVILELVTVVHGGGRWWNWFVRVWWWWFGYECSWVFCRFSFLICEGWKEKGK